jgi:serine/threonine protein kinase
MPPNGLIKHIGGGVEGEITLVEHPTRGVAILKSRKGKPQISNEANVALTLLQGEHVSRNTICQVFSIEGPASDMIIEWCDGGDLRHVINHLHSQSYCLGMSFVRHVQLHLGSALVYLHCGIQFDVITGNCKYPSLESAPWNRISHRDIKPDNIFLR